jgi:hypothetical protein
LPYKKGIYYVPKRLLELRILLLPSSVVLAMIDLPFVHFLGNVFWKLDAYLVPFSIQISFLLIFLLKTE